MPYPQDMGGMQVQPVSDVPPLQLLQGGGQNTRADQWAQVRALLRQGRSDEANVIIRGIMQQTPQLQLLPGGRT